MVKDAKGFLTDTGRFFEHREDAVEQELLAMLHNELQVEGYSRDLLETVLKFEKPLLAWLKARAEAEAASKVRAKNNNPEDTSS